MKLSSLAMNGVPTQQYNKQPCLACLRITRERYRPLTWGDGIAVPVIALPE